ncbi:MAG TPA: NUDIX domain-containing protein [Candidatus Binatia bacterium]|nr:NUDIX domain-containing protein [Candidatus Binatia bacterium]
MSGSLVLAALDGHRWASEDAGPVTRVRTLAAMPDPWSRSLLLHLTASAIVIDPRTGRVLLRWHERQQAWLQVGGHADPGETDPFRIARREAREETGLDDLSAWPDSASPRLIQVAIVSVPPRDPEPAHHHADLRYVLATGRPERAVPETVPAQLRWLGIDAAISLTGDPGLQVALRRLAPLMTTAIGP